MSATSVSSFAELKTAIEDSSTTEISVTEDITFSGGIKVNVSKSSLIIDFNGHKVVDNNNSNFTDTIYVASTTNVLSVIVKNAVWSGRNYYGVVGVYNGNTNTTISFNNITYNGPQFVYNKNGITIIKDSTIILEKNDSSTNPQEFCEANRLIIEGNVKVISYASSDAVIWFTGTGASLTVAEGANFDVSATNTYFLYTDVSPVMLFKQNSTTTITTKSGLFYASGSSTHIASSFTLEESASFTAYKQASNSIPMFKCLSSFTLKDSSTFRLYSEIISSAVLMYFGQTANIQITNPKSVVLYNRGGSVFSFGTGSASNPNVISIQTEMLRMWNIATTPLSNAGGFTDNPTIDYYKSGYKENLTLSVKATSSQLSSVENNLVSGDSGYPMTTTSLKLLTSNVISMGQLILNVNEINDISSSISGSANSLAYMKVLYNGQEETQTAQESGEFSFPLSNNLEVGTLVKVSTNQQFLTKTLDFETQGSISITSLPQLDFNFFTSKPNQKTIFRQNPDFSIEVTDTRTSGGEWGLYVFINQPLTSRENNLQDALIFKDDSKSSVLSNTPLLVYSGKWTEANKVTKITWEDVKGFLIDLDLDKIYQAGNYQTNIFWQIITTE